ncbi:DUF4160 domain-containing protein [bacterium]|nr:DUF4160 domain-containing protein [bacterium]
MGKIRRGGYIFVSWKGDHGPRHVHVYSDRKLIVKWDLENNASMKGTMTGRILKFIKQLCEENRI